MIKPPIFALLLSSVIVAPLVPVQAEPVGPGQKSAIGKPDDVQVVSLRPQGKSSYDFADLLQDNTEVSFRNGCIFSSAPVSNIKRSLMEKSGYDGFKVDDVVARRVAQLTQPTQPSQPTEPSHHKQQNQHKGTR